MAGEGLQKGWVSLYRSIQDHWLWQEKPFSKGQAWLDLLLSANHKEAKILIDNTLIQLEKGSFFTSELKLVDRWGWSKKKVRNFLELLSKDNMILKESTKKGTKLTIVNYEVYQPSRDHEGTTEEPQENHEGTIKEPFGNTNNNDNNINNDNKDNKYMSDSIEYRLSEYLYKHILKNNPKAKEPNFQTWAKTFDLILRKDKRPIEEVKELIKFSQQHDFWYKNILSPEKLRKQYDKLILERKNPKPKNSKPKDNFNNYQQRNDCLDQYKQLEQQAMEELSGEEVDGQALLDEIRNKGAD